MNKEKRIPRTYGDRTYVHGWDIKRLSYPKDHDPYCPPGGKLTFATHDRFGTEPSTPFPISETRYMLEQIKTHEEPMIIRRPMINFTTYPYTDTPDRNLNESDFPQYPKNYGYQDYVSTMQYDYRAPRNFVKRPLVMANPPYMMNQKTHSLLRPTKGVWVPPHFGIVKFDDDSAVMKPSKSAEATQQLKRFRYNSYDPFQGKYQIELSST